MYSPIFFNALIHNLIIILIINLLIILIINLNTNLIINLNTNLIISHAIISFEMMHMSIIDHTNGIPVSCD